MRQKRNISENVSERIVLLLKPRHLCDSRRIAKGIASCRWARRVQITTGEFGFVIDTNIGISNIESAKRDICKLAKGTEISEIVSHSTYMQS